MSCFWCKSKKHVGLMCKKRPKDMVDAYLKGVEDGKKASESAGDKPIISAGSDSETLGKRNTQRVGEHSSTPAPENACKDIHDFEVGCQKKPEKPNRTMCHCQADAFLSDDGESYNCAECGQFTENCKCGKPEKPYRCQECGDNHDFEVGCQKKPEKPTQRIGGITLGHPQNWGKPSKKNVRGVDTPRHAKLLRKFVEVRK
jgi:hypothetical protein